MGQPHVGWPDASTPCPQDRGEFGRCHQYIVTRASGGRVVQIALPTGTAWSVLAVRRRLADMITTLVTGATRGIGREVATQLAAAGHDVWLGARDPVAGERVAASIGARVVTLDVTDDASVAGASAAIHENGGLDVLVNNAGVPGSPLRPAEADEASLQAVFDTNVYGVVRTMHAFRGLLRASARPVVVDVSSGPGSIAAAVDPAAHGDSVPVWIAALDYGHRRRH